jgi:hypothetical protein
MVDRGFVLRPNLRPGAPLEGIRAAARPAKIGLAAGLLSLLASGLIGLLLDELVIGVTIGTILGMVWVALGLRYGGQIYLRHRLLVAMLRHNGLIPSNLIAFLEYADSHVLLHRVGGGYLFIHRLLQDYFAARAS